MSDEFQEIPPEETPLSGLSEMSEELNANLWKRRIFDAWMTVVALAEKREDAAAWFAGWLPTVMAIQSLGGTAWRVVQMLRESSVDEVQTTIDQVDWSALREDFSELQAAFPDAGHLLFGASIVDDFIDEVLASEETRAQANVLLGGVEKLIDDVVARMIDIWVHPEKAGFATDAKLSLEHVEAMLQAFLDRLLEAASR